MQENVVTGFLGVILIAMKHLVDIYGLSEQTQFSVRLLRGFVAAKKIPFFKFGHRTLRFDPEKVERALAKFEIKEVGAAK